MNTALKFCYELQGFAEITNEVPTDNQWNIILLKLEKVSVDDLIIDTKVFMAPEIFVVWLKGFVEVALPSTVYDKQWKVIKDHLQLIFTKVTPSYEDEDDDTEMAKRVNDIFEGIRNNRTPMSDLNKLDLICACGDTSSINKPLCAGDDLKAYCCSDDSGLEIK